MKIIILLRIIICIQIIIPLILAQFCTMGTYEYDFVSDNLQDKHVNGTINSLSMVYVIRNGTFNIMSINDIQVDDLVMSYSNQYTRVINIGKTKIQPNMISDDNGCGFSYFCIGDESCVFTNYIPYAISSYYDKNCDSNNYNSTCLYGAQKYIHVTNTTIISYEYINNYGINSTNIIYDKYHTKIFYVSDLVDYINDMDLKTNLYFCMYINKINKLQIHTCDATNIQTENGYIMVNNMLFDLKA